MLMICPFIVLCFVDTYTSCYRVDTILPVPNHLAITPGPNVKGVWIEPVPELITGDLKIWSTAASVDPVRIPGYWLHKSGSTIPVGASPMPGEKVVLALH